MWNLQGEDSLGRRNVMVGVYQYYNSSTSTALVGYLFSSFGRVLDLKSRGPRFNSRVGFISTFPFFPVTNLLFGH